MEIILKEAEIAALSKTLSDNQYKVAELQKKKTSYWLKSLVEINIIFF